jgi:hypothetical protein
LLLLFNICSTQRAHALRSPDPQARLRRGALSYVQVPGPLGDYSRSHQTREAVRLRFGAGFG